MSESEPVELTVANRPIFTLRAESFGRPPRDRVAAIQPMVSALVERGGPLEVTTVETTEGVMVVVDGSLLFRVLNGDVNPETGAAAQNILGYGALMLRPGQTLRLPARSPAMVFHVIEGGAQVDAEGPAFALGEADTCCIPGYTGVTLRNTSSTQPSFLFVADETPLHQKLGVYEVRG